MRVKAVISYNGANFLGFQRQKSTNNTITTHIENALQSINIESPITGSGRTDAGVHATGQVIHFDLPHYWHNLKKLTNILNDSLCDIHIKHISFVDSDFHARFHAKKRTYRYIFKTDTPNIFESNFIAHLPLQDSKKLQNALSYFIGTHDFGNFIKSGSVTKDNIRTIYQAYHIQRNQYHYIYFQANGFLRSQVRMITDFSLKVANGQLNTAQLQEQLNMQAKYSSYLAPAQGLYLARVIY